MNIALFSPNQNPYSETFIQAHKNYLKDDVFYYYGVGDHIKLENHPPLVSTLNRIWLKAIQIIFKKSSHYIWSKAVARSLKKHKIDVILIEYGTHAHRLLPVLELARIPFAVQFHGYDASVRAVIDQRNSYKMLFAKASKVFAVSTTMKDMLIDIGCSEKKLVYNVNGSNSDFAKVEPTFTKPQFIAAGRFTDKKAPYYLILAFQKVVEKFPDAKLILAGEGGLSNTCSNLIDYFGLRNHIEMVGVITPEVFLNYLSESLAFVQHSITANNGDMEGTPVAVIEANMAGLPVVSTYHAGITDVIIHEKTGLLSAEHDVDAMANHMIKLLEDKTYAIKLGKAGKANCIQNYSLERHISVLQNELEQIKLS